MEIKVGELVRTHKGIIGTLQSQELTYPEPSEWILNVNGKEVVIVECDDYITKHSENLIDLIEVRRYSIYTRCTKQWFCLHLWWRNAKSSKRRYRRGLTDYKNINTSTVWTELL